MDTAPDSKRRRTIDTAALFTAGIVLITLFSGCATQSMVSASNEIATAQFAIRDARSNGAEELAPEPFRKANELLARARDLSGDEAKRTAASAVAYAQLSSTIAQRDSALQQLRDSVRMDQEAEALKVRTTNAVEERIQ